MNFNFLQLLPLMPLFFVALAGLIYFILAYYLVVGFRDSRLNMVLWSSVALKLIYPLLFSVMQYYIFASNALSKELLNSSLYSTVLADLPFFLKPFTYFFEGNLGYFLYYSWSRFFLGTALALLCALIFYAFLKILEKYNPRLFKEGEAKVGFIVALLVGWPWFLVLIPATFIATILISIVKRIFFKESYTTLGIPILVAGIILTVATYLFHTWLLGALNLSVLSV